MVDKRILGSLWILVVATSIIYIGMGDDVKLRVDDSKTTFYVHDGRWLISGIEYNKLFNGSKLAYRYVGSITVNMTIDEINNITTIVRTTPFRTSSKAKIIDTYIFDGEATELELFPVSHTVELLNASGHIYQYEVQRLVYNGTTKWDVDSPQSFGRNMKVEWDEGNYYSRIYKFKNKDEGKLTIKYRITEDYVKLNMRLFDPPEFNLIWTNTKNSIGRQEYLVEVNGTKAVINFETMFSEANFNAKKLKNIKLTKRAVEHYVEDVYGYEKIIVPCTLNNTELVDGEIEKSKKATCTEEVWTKIGTAQKERIVFTPMTQVSKISTKLHVKTKFPINTMTKGDVYKISFDTPIINSSLGFGSSGKVAFMVDEVEYHPVWDSLWKRYKDLTITNNVNSDLSNHQILLNVSHDTYMQADFDDIRFTYVNGSSDTEIPYWIENKVDSSYADVWINATYLPASGTADYRIYFNNPAASSGSNGNDTFLFFDTFDAAIDTDKWVVRGTPSVSAGAVTISAAGEESIYSKVFSLAESDNYIVEAKINSHTTLTGIRSGMPLLMDRTNAAFGGDGFDGHVAKYDSIFVSAGRNGILIDAVTQCSGASCSYLYTEQLGDSTPVILGFLYNDTETIFYKNRTNITSSSTHMPSGTMYVGLAVNRYSTANIPSVVSDWIIVRQSVSVAPTYSFSRTVYSSNNNAYLTANEEHFTRNFEEYSGNWLQIDDFEDVDTWHHEGGADTSDYKEGTQSIYRESSGHCCADIRKTFSASIDMSMNGSIEYWVHVNETNINNIMLVFQNNDSSVYLDSAGVDNWQCLYTSFSLGWNHMSIPITDCTVRHNSTGGVNWDDINSIFIYQYPNVATGYQLYAKYDDLKLVSSDGYTYNILTGSEDFAVHSGKWSIVNTTDENGVETDVLAEQTHITTYQFVYRNQSFNNITMTGKYKRLTDAGSYVRIVFSQTFGGLLPCFRFDPNEFVYNEGGDTYVATTNDAYPFTNDTWISFKFEITSNGNSDKIKGRVWNSTDIEPTTWDFDRDSTQISDWYYVQLAVYDHTGLFDDIQIVEHQSWADNLSETGYIPSTDNITAEFLRPEGVTGEAYAVFENARNDSAVACYSFEDDYTDQCGTYDLISGTGDDLTPAGKYGSGLELSDGYVRQTTPFEYENQSLTYCAWTYLINTTQTHPWVIGESGWNDGSIAMGYSGKPSFAFTWKSSNGTAGRINYAMPSDYMYKWYHFCGVMDYESMASIYVNGVSVVNTTSPATWGWRLDDETRIGSSWGTHLWNGTIDEVRIYDTALSATEVSNLYENGKWKHSTPKAVAQWSFNGDAKDTSVACALDSATCDNGILTGAMITNQGRFGQGVAFDGDGDTITIAGIDINNIAGSLSVWVNSKSTATQGIFTFNLRPLIYLSGGNLQVHWTPWYTSTHSITKNEWHNIVFTWKDGSINANYSLYLDSVLLESGIQDLSAPTTTLIVGGYAGSNYLNGSMDEVAIYDFALTAQQVADLYNRTFKIRDLAVKDDWNATIHTNIDNSYYNTTSQQLRVGVPALSLLFNGTAADQYYEVQHNANITAGWLVEEDTGEYWSDLGTVALTIDHPDKGTNYTGGAGRIEDLWATINGLNKFNDSTTSKSIEFAGSDNQTSYINMDKYAEAVGLRFNVSLLNDTVTNLTFYIANEKENVGYGELVGTNKYSLDFWDEGTIFNLTYLFAGTQVKQAILSKTAVVTGVPTINLDGFDYGLDFEDDFTSTDDINTGQTTAFVNTEETDLVELSREIGISNELGNGLTQCDYYAGSYVSIGQTFKARTSELLGFAVRIAKAEHGTDINYTIGIGTSFADQDLWNETISPNDYTEELSGTDPGEWVTFEFDSVSLTPGTTYYLSVKPVPANCLNSDTICLFHFGIESYVDGEYYIGSELSGDGLDQAFRIYDYYSDSSNVLSASVYNPSLEIEKATLNSSYNKPANTDIGWWLSANNGVNWENVTLDSEYAFTNKGVDLKWKATLNTTDTTATPKIYNISLETPKGYPLNITIDIGADGSNEYIGTTEINTSTSINLTSTGYNNYLTSSDCEGIACQVPITITSASAGILQISDIEVNYTLLPNFNETAIQAYLDNDTLCSPQEFTNFSTIHSHREIDTNNINIWTTAANATIYKYDMDGAYVSEFVSDPIVAMGISFYDSYLYVGGMVEREVYKYDLDGNLISHFDTSGQAGYPYAIATNGTYIWMGNGETTVFKYTMAGGYLSSFSVSSLCDHIYGLESDSSYLYVGCLNLFPNEGRILKYSLDGIYSGDYILPPVGNALAISVYDNEYWVGVSSGNVIHKSTLDYSIYDTTCDIPITLYSDTAGNLTIDTLNLSYKGYQNLTVTVESEGSSLSRYLYLAYSSFTESLPSGVDYWELFPKSYTQENVTPYGQTSDTPIWFIQGTNYKLPFDLSFKLNETLSCINITASNDSAKANGSIMNTTYQTLVSSIGVYGNTSIWEWVDLNGCNSTGLRWWNPTGYFKAQCSECI